MLHGSSEFNLGSGDLSETSLSLYQTGIKNNGFYYDVIAKAGKYNNDYDITNLPIRVAAIIALGLTALAVKLACARI
jgi:outer membrane autotransporter protein